ncbi:ABC transporter ATP-binding protein [Ilumatobacter sp.]|uniref:ABC transporter ATP-binding protein n=1 Tax=Ilumatobacter sp. TaxID=1967498 RepID=UPI003C704A30
MGFPSPDRSRLIVAASDIDLAIEEGQFLAIVGPSGCGKTTLLNVLAGLIQPSRGTVVRHDQPVQRGGKDLGYMLARGGLCPWRTARKNVEYGLEVRGVRRKERRERALDALDDVRMLDFADSYPAQLSNGMRQRVAIARTMVIQPGLLLMDEPFGALDAQTRLTVQDSFLSSWERHRTTVLLVTHDLSEAVLMADRVVVMSARPGQIKRDLMIDLERPRNIAELRFDKRFTDLEHDLWLELRSEII